MIYSFVSLFALLVVILVNYEVIFNWKYPAKFPKVLKSFRFFLLSVSFYIISDIAWGFTDPLPNKLPATIVTSIYFVAMSLLFFAWTNYIRLYINSKYKVFNYILFFGGLLFAIYGVTLVIINIFTPIMFTYYDVEQYTHFLARDIYLFILVGLYFGTFLFGTIAAFNKEYQRKNQFLCVGAFGFIMTLFTVLQYFFPLYPQYAGGLALGSIIINAFIVRTEKSLYKKALLENEMNLEKQLRETDTAKQLAYTDPLTGIKNKHAYVELEERLDKLIHDKEIDEFSLFIFDLNDLKNINDVYGHDMGDKYIIKSVEIIAKRFKGGEIYRYGGDEFVIVLQGALYKNRYQLFKEFNKEMEHNINMNEPVISVGFSDFVPENDNALRSVFNRADERMYARKRRLKVLASQNGQNDTNKIKAQNSLNFRQEIFEMFYNSPNFSLIDMLNGSSADEIMEIDVVHDRYKQFYHVQGKYFVPNVGMSYKELLDFTYKYIVHPDDRGIYMSLMKPEGFFERLENARIPNFDFAHFRYKLQDGEYRYVEQIIITGEQYGIPEGMFRMYVMDIDNLKSRQLGVVSDDSSIISVGRDAVTGLLTGKEFFNKAEAAMKKHPEIKWCLLAIDIEHFKFFDEWFGREKGDILLAKIGAELTTSVEEFGGVAGYFGGDDFSALVPYDNTQIQSLYYHIHEHISTFGMTAGFLPAIGVSVLEKDMVLVDAFDRASIAASRAKKDLRNRIMEYSDEMQFLAEQEFRILTEFMHALNNGEITFYLQPQCRISTKAIVGAEALARWIKLDGTIIPPGEFIPVLEKYGFVTDLDKYIWDVVCKNIKIWIEQGHKAVPISLNVSRLDIYNLDIAQYFHDLCDKYEIPHNLIKIEITESAYAEITETIDDLVKRLRNDGFLVLMDDFGSGYSSLNMLSNLKLDAIKLDGKFMQIEDGDLSRGVHILESVINMAKTIGLPVIIEGVETQKQSDFLEDMGCRYAQGYFFYKPMPKSEFEKLVLDEKKIDHRGFVVKLNEQFRVREFLDKNMYSDSMLNSVLGPVAIYSWDKGEHVDIVRFNQQFYEAVGVPDFAERLVNIEQYVPEKDRPKLFKALKEAMDNRLTGAEEVVGFYRTDGSLSSFRLHFYYLNKKEGRERFYGSALEVTELVNIKDAKNLIAEYSTDNMIFISRRLNRWHYTVISHSLSDLIGLSPSELEEELNNGQFAAKRVTSQKDLKDFMRKSEKNAEEKKNFTQRFEVVGKAGNKVSIELEFTNVSNETNNVEYIMNTKLVDASTKKD